MARPEVTGKKPGRRLLDYQALRARGIPWSRVHLARLEAAGKFPLHIDVGENSVAWFEDEIDDFLEMKAAERDAKARARADLAKAEVEGDRLRRSRKPRDDLERQASERW
jgi:prophage regulatory protein